MSGSSSNGRQNWAALGLELVVVVVGILLALAIDAYWVERGDRGLELALLEQLGADLGRAETHLKDQISQTEDGARAAADLYTIARDRGEVPSDSVTAWLVRVSWWSDPAPTTATAQGVLSSNSLPLIQNEQLRAQLVLFLDQVRQLEMRVPRYEEEIWRWMEEINRVADPRARGISIYPGILDAGVEDEVVMAMNAYREQDIVALLTWDGFSLAVHQLFYAHDNLRWLQARMIEATVELREAIQAELSRRGD